MIFIGSEYKNIDKIVKLINFRSLTAIPECYII